MPHNIMRWLALFRPPWPVSHLLAACIVALALPLVVLVGIDALRLTVNERARLHGEASLTAERIAADLDQTINSYIAIPRNARDVTRPGQWGFRDALRAGDCCSEAQRSLRVLARCVRAATSSIRVWPTARRCRKASGSMRQLFENRHPYVSDVVMGDVARRPVAAVSVPVVRNGKIKYVLSLSLELGLVKALLDRQKLPESWNVTVVDRNAVEIASTDASGESAEAASPAADRSWCRPGSRDPSSSAEGGLPVPAR